jgi:hypothetical protein
MGNLQSKVVALQYAAPQIEQQVAPILRTFARPVGEADELFAFPLASRRSTPECTASRLRAGPAVECRPPKRRCRERLGKIAGRNCPSNRGSASHVGRQDRGQARSLYRPVRRIPRGASIGLEDLLGALRQQQVLGSCLRCRASGRGSCLCGSHRHPPGRSHCRRASPFIRPWRHGL